ncbi:hypothetical protein KSC_100240 [Ktedonobacter sp. SOSP1-52]|uniref:hypothetical protein n=1 Tax=Ktedonobacter sp. SOSP1-52 TaxID=2778366 RepID=UPI001A2FA6DB|nr:hypothetical protein [Ktedonobacter sp. SOSP1-52]GHO71132.1 hypothetical protein KSC_100240 [Ktedonobacter sp. SOSP1-52]
MIPNASIEVQTTPRDRPSIPAWFAEVVMLSQHLTTKGLLEAFAHHIQFVRGRFGSYEPIDFLALLFGYAMSGERTLLAGITTIQTIGTSMWVYQFSKAEQEPLKVNMQGRTKPRPRTSY